MPTSNNTQSPDIIKDAQKVLMIGIGGAGMCGLAGILADLGKHIIGTDQNVARIMGDKRYDGMTLLTEAEIADEIEKTEIVIYSDAIPQNHPLLEKSKKLEKPTLMLFEAVGMLTHHYRTIAVAGAHGKSSTTAMLAHILIKAGLDPTVLVGATVPGWVRGNSRVGKSNLFIIEADEYRKHLLHLQPYDVIITTIDFDHPDCFSSVEDVAKTFNDFIQLMPVDGHLVTVESTWNRFESILQLKGEPHFIAQPIDDLVLSLPGEHMKMNATLAITMAEQLGVTREDAIEHLKSFVGLGRRFERIGSINAMETFTDYAHHPTEISATINAAREQFVGKKILAIFEPHTEERFTAFFDGYKESLAEADGALICPIYRARGSKPSTRDSKELAEALSNSSPARGGVRGGGSTAWHISDYSQLSSQLSDVAHQFDIAIAFTAGELDAQVRGLK